MLDSLTTLTDGIQAGVAMVKGGVDRFYLGISYISLNISLADTINSGLAQDDIDKILCTRSAEETQFITDYN